MIVCGFSERVASVGRSAYAAGGTIADEASSWSQAASRMMMMLMSRRDSRADEVVKRGKSTSEVEVEGAQIQSSRGRTGP